MTMADNVPSPRGYRYVLAQPSFLRLWLGQIISQFGDGFYWLAMMLAVSELTGGDVQAVGLVSISFLLPQIPIGLLSGPVVDQVNRRYLMIVADVLRIFTTLACIWVYVLQALPLFYVLALIQSIISGFFFPAKNALIPQLIEERDLITANTLSQTTQVGAMIFGPALAGFAIEHAGVPVSFVVDAVTFLISAFFLLSMAPVPTLGRGETSVRQAWRDLQEGVRYTVTHPRVRNVMMVVSVLFLGLGAINVLWVPYLQRVFHASPQQIGLVDAFQGLGMLIGSLLMGLYVFRKQRPEFLLLGTLLIVSSSFVALGLAPSYEFILAIIFIFGIPVPAGQASFMTIIQRSTPQILLGRVNGAVGAVTNGAMLVSMAVATQFAERIGLRESYVIFGLLGYVAVVLGVFTLFDRDIHGEAVGDVG